MHTLQKDNRNENERKCMVNEIWLEMKKGSQTHKHVYIIRGRERKIEREGERERERERGVGGQRNKERVRENG